MSEIPTEADLIKARNEELEKAMETELTKAELKELLEKAHELLQNAEKPEMTEEDYLKLEQEYISISIDYLKDLKRKYVQNKKRTLSNVKTVVEIIEMIDKLEGK